METIKIIKTSLPDLAKLEKVSKQSFIESYADKNTPENMEKYLAENFNLQHLSAQLQNRDSEFYFATSNDIIAGYLKLNFGKAQSELKYPDSVEIERVYVLKEFQGKKIGQLLCNKAFQVGQQHKADYIWLGVWEGNNKAIGFYRKYGFTEFDKHTFKFGDDLQTDLLMKLEI